MTRPPFSTKSMADLLPAGQLKMVVGPCKPRIPGLQAAIQHIAFAARRSAAEQLAQDAELIAGHRRLPCIEVDDASVLKAVLGDALDLVTLVKTDRDDFALDLHRVKEGAPLRDTCDVVVAVTLKVDAGRRRGRAHDGLDLALRHAFPNLGKGAGLGVVTAVVDLWRAACQNASARKDRHAAENGCAPRGRRT